MKRTSRVERKAEAHLGLAGIQEIVIPFEKLMLDPNNPRLRTADRLKKTNERFIHSPQVQAETEQRMWKKNGHYLKALQAQMAEIGFVKSLGVPHAAKLPGVDLYVLNDANCRVTAIRDLQRQVATGAKAVSQQVADSWKNMRVAYLGEYDLSDPLFKEKWDAIRGKLHLSGAKPWGLFQRAAYLAELRDSGHTVESLIKLTGTRRSGAASIKSMLEAWDLFQLARTESDYGPRLGEKNLTLFQELIYSKPQREYLGWSHDRRTVNRARLLKFLELLVPKDGSKGYLQSGAQVVRLRNLQDVPDYWEKALDHKKNKKFLDQLEAIGSCKDINEMTEKFVARLRKMTVAEARLVDVDYLKEIARLVPQVLADRERLEVKV